MPASLPSFLRFLTSWGHVQSRSWLPDQQAVGTCGRQGNKLTPVGFEPTPLRNGALSHRLRPLGQSVDECEVSCRVEQRRHASWTSLMFSGGAQPAIGVVVRGPMGGRGQRAADREEETTPVGFEPTPLRSGALSHRLRPLGQTVLVTVELAYMCTCKL